jgi:hypothetical protein
MGPGLAGLIISVAFLAARRRRQTSTELYQERRYTESPA